MTHRIAGLDLLRALAVLWVMLFHSFLVGGLGPQFEWLSRFGWAGVDMFFVLSGYLIGAQVLRPLQRGAPFSFRDFYARRAWRILPSFGVVLAFYVGVPALREAPGLQPWWQFASMTMNLLIDYSNNQAFSHAWSLCVEEHFYLVFPLLAVGMARRPTVQRFVWLCGVLVLLGIVLRGAVWLHNEALDPPRNWYIEDIYYPTWMRLDGLLAGVVLACLQVYRPQVWAALQARANASLVAGVLIASLAFWLFRDRTGLLANTLGWPLLSVGFACLVLAGAAPQCVLARLPLPGLGWIAGISYSLYMSHKIAFHLVQEALVQQGPQPGWVRFLVYAGASLALGAALHYAVERPCLRLRDRRAGALRSRQQLV